MLSDLDPRALATNDVPSDEERNVLRLRQAAARRDLAALDAEIALALDLDITGSTPNMSESFARKKRRGLVKLIRSIDIAIAPHKFLPAELMSCIFTLAFSAFPTYLPPPGRTSSPLALCHVCIRWRKVALNTPELWTDVVFRYERNLNPYKTMDLVEEWFARCGPSKRLSLEISRWTRQEFPSDHEEVMQVVFLRLIAAYALRFSHLVLRLPEAQIYSFLATSSLAFPCLRSIHLERDTYMDDTLPSIRKQDTSFIFSRQAPLVTDMELHNFRHILEVEATFFTWNNLTRFRCHHTPIKVSEIHSILQQCRKLEDCQLNVDPHINEDDVKSASKTRIRLPFLRRLAIFFGFLGRPGLSEQLVGPFLEPLFIPNVKELHISSVNHARGFPQQALISLLTRSSCDIDVLQISDIYLSEETVSQLAVTLPSLTMLHVGVDHLLPKAVLQEVAKGQLLPKLQCLVCRIDDLETAIQMLENRWEASKSPSSPSIQLSPPVFFMLDYVGEVINLFQAVRVDRLRACGVRIEMNRVGC
ncbi:hypothetical protein GALMADRAFT_370316 [Galerina marginata CBS 339.88]|uniref:Uncharacterized protein n=1 Tax=Galerina marginata (strain CBS 339.88) TaxID=685588 RepID=A0A067TZX8_GALM3|nr:hypothetical protein GALMADRAFT_370316 [Galerina marginata CBS 339.88]